MPIAPAEAARVSRVWEREIEACGYWLEKELAAIKPKVVVALGSTALKAVLDNPKATLKDAMGQPIAHGGRAIQEILA